MLKDRTVLNVDGDIWGVNVDLLMGMMIEKLDERI